MNATIQKWGNSLAVRLHKAVVREAELDNGSEVDISVQDGQVILKRANKTQYKLDELLKGVTKKNLHPEVDWGRPVGKEVW